jgi:hypothetical protein
MKSYHVMASQLLSYPVNEKACSIPRIWELLLGEAVGIPMS